MTTPPVVLSVAGTDSGGAAGTAADLTTFAALGVHGACVVTAVTAQHTLGVDAIHPVPLEVVSAQLSAVLDDLPVAAVKTGMLGSAEAVRLVAERCAGLPLVVDPVLVATSGAVLGGKAVRDAYLRSLLPVATVVTPNLTEAAALAGADAAGGRAQPAELAKRLAGHGCGVLLTGGPEWRPGDVADTCTDWLALPDGTVQRLQHSTLATTNDHGTGCTFSAAVAALLAHGHELESAAEMAAGFTTTQLARGSAWRLGRGRGPIAHVNELRSTR
ncbi:bifunctional hydroxymethylpyrimidine kinase/phosphomethylpyrimidine kinase [Nocardioides sp. Bht2]|uniref:bifunctional hydroxymethylpyrimidine kinase/phosphomethylpyrimidine kinase n=1 Tax=Nocardioides sp. Bht2 TaxID=3392297 RepID=UPI0039B69F73